MDWHSLNSRKVPVNFKSKDPPARIKRTNISSIEILSNLISHIGFLIYWSFLTVSDFLKIRFASIWSFGYVLEKVLDENTLVAPLDINVCIIFLQ
jgi:hypothetical protein